LSTQNEKNYACLCPACFANACLANRDTTKLDPIDSDLEPNSKRLRLSHDAPIYVSPIKGTHTCNLNEQVHAMKPGRLTAVLAQPYFEGQKSLSSSCRHKVPLWPVLLDSGSDGDLLFRKHGARLLNKSVPYVIRAIPQS